jgi:hypothetical protein
MSVAGDEPHADLAGPYVTTPQLTYARTLGLHHVIDGRLALSGDGIAFCSGGQPPDALRRGVPADARARAVPSQYKMRVRMDVGSALMAARTSLATSLSRSITR